MIDTEPADGNVYKMLLGSFVEEYDGMDKDDHDTAAEARASRREDSISTTDGDDENEFGISLEGR